MRLTWEFKTYRLSRNPLKFVWEGSFRNFLNDYWSLAAVSGAFFSRYYCFYFWGVFIKGYGHLIFLLIVGSRSSLPFKKLGWLNILFELSLRDLWNPYILSCLIKLLIFRCRKYFASTTSWNLLISLITKSFPVVPQ